jgi:hypothetical protein
MRTLLIAIFLTAATSVLTAAAAWPGTYLVVSGGEPERVLACLPLEKGTSFYLEFINSIYLAPVRETLEYEPSEGICLVRVESPSAGVFEYYGLIPYRPDTALLHRPVGQFRLRSQIMSITDWSLGERAFGSKGSFLTASRCL